MPNLPHIKNNKVAQDIAEDVTLNRFNVLVTPPTGLPSVSWLKEEIKTIGGLDKIDVLPEIVTQLSRGHTRIYSGSFVDDTTLELTMTINLNAHGDKANDVIIYKMFKAWARRNRNEKTGATSLKRDSIGTVVIEQHNKIGEIWRQVDCTRVMIQEMSGLDEASLEAGDPAELSITLRVEEFDVNYGGDEIAE